jgi:EAL domain-containing protein (putative c-di-GMP-specific phosphodiesterase class I)
MSVNVSAVQFASMDFAETAARILKSENMPPHYLELELTESLLLAGMEESVKQMKITEPQGTYPIVTAILSLANALKIETVAEGIETEVQLALLTELGANRFQGYLFAKPLPASEIPGYLQRAKSAPVLVTD